jgi:hypothetical protein
MPLLDWLQDLEQPITAGTSVHYSSPSTSTCTADRIGPLAGSLGMGGDHSWLYAMCESQSLLLSRTLCTRVHTKVSIAVGKRGPAHLGNLATLVAGGLSAAGDAVRAAVSLAPGDCQK